MACSGCAVRACANHGFQQEANLHATVRMLALRVRVASFFDSSMLLRRWRMCFVQHVDESEAIEAVHEAFRAGINVFDTSPFYGNTRSETVLGKALQGLPRDELIVCTKVGRYGQEDFDFSPTTITERFKQSLHRLQLDYVDVLQCHDIEFGDLSKVLVFPMCCCAPCIVVKMSLFAE